MKYLIAVLAFAAFAGSGLYYFFSSRGLDWRLAQKLVRRDCVEQPLEFIKSQAGWNYLLELAAKLEQGQYFSLRELPRGNTYCWLAWQGGADGAGNIVYETGSGKTKQLKVNNFPLYAPSILDPASGIDL